MQCVKVGFLGGDGLKLKVTEWKSCQYFLSKIKCLFTGIICIDTE